MNNKSFFSISIDFELLWGVIGKDNYLKNIEGVKEVVDKTLNFFEYYNIHATWAIVGSLCSSSKEELYNLSKEQNFNIKIENVDDKYLFAPKLVKKIKDLKFQELASHTFSHYYCLEKDFNIGDFSKDMQLFEKISRIKPNSFVFPRNQYSSACLSLLKDNDIKIFRGNEKSILYKPQSKSKEAKVKKIFRFLDAYINISGSNTYSLNSINNTIPYNLPSSRFLRPYSKKLKFLENLKIFRIKRAMLYAAKNNEIFHLWWHPHNFGVNLNENLINLEKILKYYQKLSLEYGMLSRNMEEIAFELERIKK